MRCSEQIPASYSCSLSTRASCFGGGIHLSVRYTLRMDELVFRIGRRLKVNLLSDLEKTLERNDPLVRDFIPKSYSFAHLVLLFLIALSYWI